VNVLHAVPSYDSSSLLDFFDTATKNHSAFYLLNDHYHLSNMNCTGWWYYDLCIKK